MRTQHWLSLACAALLELLPAVQGAPTVRERRDDRTSMERRMTGMAIEPRFVGSSAEHFRRATPDEHYAGLLNNVRQVRHKFDALTKEDRRRLAKRQDQGGSVQMANTRGDIQYYGSIELGSPPQRLEVILDTGSSDLLVAIYPCEVGCEASTPIYQPTLSSTAYESTIAFSTTYGSGAAQGTLAQDKMSMSGFTVDRQTFAACHNFTNIVENDVSGILGLGWERIASSRSTPFLQNLWQDGQLDEPLFGFAFSRWGNTSGAYYRTLPGGYMTIGGVNETLVDPDEIVYIDLSSESYWPIPLQDVKVGGESLNITDDFAIIDTGTSLIGMPISAVQRIYAGIPGARLDAEEGTVTFPCDAATAVSFTFGGRDWEMSADDFNVGRVSAVSNICLGAVFVLPPTSGGTEITIFGDAFLKNVYSVYRFDPPAVGFAPLREGAQELLRQGHVPVSNATTAIELARSRPGSSDTATDSEGNTMTMDGQEPVSAASSHSPLALTSSISITALALLAAVA